MNLEGQFFGRVEKHLRVALYVQPKWAKRVARFLGLSRE